jgi:hypothetical protein
MPSAREAAAATGVLLNWLLGPVRVKQTVETVRGRVQTPGQDAVDALLDMSLPPTPAADLLRVTLGRMGFTLEPATAHNQLRSTRRHAYVLASRGRHRLILLHIPGTIVNSPDYANQNALLQLEKLNFDSAPVVLFSDAARIDPTIQNQTYAWATARRAPVHFLSTDDVVQRLQDKTEKYQEDELADLLKPVLDYQPPGGGSSGSGGQSALRPDDFELLVGIVVRQARAAPSGKRQFFQSVISKARLPDSFKDDLAEIGEKDPDQDARGLINWAVAKGNLTVEGQSCTVLGVLLRALRGKLGDPDGPRVDTLIKTYRL